MDIIVKCYFCKEDNLSLSKIGNEYYCYKCHQLIYKQFGEKIDLQGASFLEREMAIDIFIFALNNGWDVHFQYPIHDESDIKEGCKLEEAAERDHYEFRCPRGFETYDRCDSNGCKFCYYNPPQRYVRYILDFALFKKDKRIDLELDGFTFHNKPYDDERDNFLKMLGWEVIRIPSSKVFLDKWNAFQIIKSGIEEIEDDRGIPKSIK